MENTSIEPLRLDAWHNNNWTLAAKPVATLNEASTLHERVAYCWGIANDLQDLSILLVNQDSVDISRLASLFLNQVKPLVVMLDHLGSSTCANEKKMGGAA